jgi:hypothetical protein
MQQVQVSKWENAQLNLEPLKELNPPIKVVLTALQVAEAVLEGVLDILKSVMLAFDNPLNAVVSLLLAAIRLIINQIRATGFAVLFVLPDFSRASPSSILASVSGAYPEFEKKVVYKLQDTSDLFRPDYPEGSSVAMGILYIGADTPGDLLGNIFALVSFFSSDSLNIRNFLPAPTNVKVSPVSESTDPVSTFLEVGRIAVRTFTQAGNGKFLPSLVVEWSIPSTVSGSSAPGFLNPFIALAASFSFPYFMIERTTVPNGKSIDIKVDTPTAGNNIEVIQSRYGNIKNKNTRVLRDSDGITPFRYFEDKFIVETARLVQGGFTNVYRYEDTTVKPGITYYYRVRAFYGNPSNYVAAKEGSYIAENLDLIKISGNTPIMKYGPSYINGVGVLMGKSSSVAAGVAPTSVLGSSVNPYVDFYNALLCGFLLNMELPPAFPEDSDYTRQQKTGWGSLSSAGSVIVSYKLAFKTNLKFQESPLVKAAVRRMVNSVINSFYNNPAAAADVYEALKPLKFKIESTINNKLISWSWPEYNFGDITGGIPESVKLKINSYLSRENNYIAGQKILQGPYPTFPWSAENLTNWDATDRAQLGSLISSIFSAFSANAGYLRWYSLTLGDLFPAFIPLVFNLEEFIGAILKSLKSVLQEVNLLIENILTKIRQLEEIINAISAVINLLSVNLTVSVFGFASYDGSTASLASGLTSSENKPVSTPYGLHSGIVVTAGGLGAGPIKIFEALGFILGIEF